MFKRIISLIVCLAFGLSNLQLVYGQPAGAFVLPSPGTMVHLSPPFNPPTLKGIKVHADNPFFFDFVLDPGDSSKQEQLKTESSKLIKYFLASLTIPDNDLWVNLSPYEKGRIIPQSFGLTQMGRDLLAEDYMLKQITASLIYPEGETGKKFWKRVYEESAKRFGSTNVPVNTFNKVWIVPQTAVVYENVKTQTAYVVESKLKVMLEEDYLALSKNRSQPGDMFKPEQQRTCPQAGCQANQALNVKATQVNNGSTSALGSQIIREIVIPELTKEVNFDKNFAPLRQVYDSLILATWYKKKIKDSVFAQVYADKNKVAGVNINDPQEKQRIYGQYLKAFKKGVYNYIKEDRDTLTQQVVPRKYFSGGYNFAMVARILTTTTNKAMVADSLSKALMKVSATIQSIGKFLGTLSWNSWHFPRGRAIGRLTFSLLAITLATPFLTSCASDTDNDGGLLKTATALTGIYDNPFVLEEEADFDLRTGVPRRTTLMYPDDPNLTIRGDTNSPPDDSILGYQYTSPERFSAQLEAYALWIRGNPSGGAISHNLWGLHTHDGTGDDRPGPFYQHLANDGANAEDFPFIDDNVFDPSGLPLSVIRTIHNGPNSGEWFLAQDGHVATSDVAFLCTSFLERYKASNDPQEQDELKGLVDHYLSILLSPKMQGPGGGVRGGPRDPQTSPYVQSWLPMSYQNGLYNSQPVRANERLVKLLDYYAQVTGGDARYKDQANTIWAWLQTMRGQGGGNKVMFSSTTYLDATTGQVTGYAPIGLLEAGTVTDVPDERMAPDPTEGLASILAMIDQAVSPQLTGVYDSQGNLEGIARTPEESAQGAISVAETKELSWLALREANDYNSINAKGQYAAQYKRLMDLYRQLKAGADSNFNPDAQGYMVSPSDVFLKDIVEIPRFSEAGPNGDNILRDLIKGGILQDISSTTEVRLTANLNDSDNKDRIKQIAGDKFDIIWGILQQYHVKRTPAEHIETGLGKSPYGGADLTAGRVESFGDADPIVVNSLGPVQPGPNQAMLARDHAMTAAKRIKLLTSALVFTMWTGFMPFLSGCNDWDSLSSDYRDAGPIDASPAVDLSPAPDLSLTLPSLPTPTPPSPSSFYFDPMMDGGWALTPQGAIWGYNFQTDSTLHQWWRFDFEIDDNNMMVLESLRYTFYPNETVHVELPAPAQDYSPAKDVNAWQKVVLHAISKLGGFLSLGWNSPGPFLNAVTPAQLGATSQFINILEKGLSSIVRFPFDVSDLTKQGLKTGNKKGIDMTIVNRDLYIIDSSLSGPDLTVTTTTLNFDTGEIKTITYGKNTTDPQNPVVLSFDQNNPNPWLTAVGNLKTKYFDPNGYNNQNYPGQQLSPDAPAALGALGRIVDFWVAHNGFTAPPNMAMAAASRASQHRAVSKIGPQAANPTGGIDLTPSNMNLQTRMPANLKDWRGLASFAGGDSRFRGNDRGIKFHLDPAMLKQLQNAPGFEPVIVNIQPLKSLPEFLGFEQEA